MLFFVQLQPSEKDRFIGLRKAEWSFLRATAHFGYGAAFVGETDSGGIDIDLLDL